MAFSHEDRAGRNSIHRIQEYQYPFLKLEGRSVPNQGEIVEAKRLTQPNTAELPVDRVGIGKRLTLPSHGYAHLLFRNGKRELQLHGSLQIQSLHQKLETIPSHPDGIGSWFQLGRYKLAQPVRQKHEWLREVLPGDLDPRPRNDCARRILNSSRNRFRT